MSNIHTHTHKHTHTEKHTFTQYLRFLIYHYYYLQAPLSLPLCGLWGSLCVWCVCVIQECVYSTLTVVCFIVFHPLSSLVLSELSTATTSPPFQRDRSTIWPLFHICKCVCVCVRQTETANEISYWWSLMCSLFSVSMWKLVREMEWVIWLLFQMKTVVGHQLVNG